MDAARGGQDQKEEDAEAWQPSDAEAVETEETHVIHVEVDATAAWEEKVVECLVSSPSGYK